MNLARLGEESVERFGEHAAPAFEGRVFTNVDPQRAASRVAHALRRLGVDVGDRVAVLLPNCPEDARRLSAHKRLDATEVAS